MLVAETSQYQYLSWICQFLNSVLSLYLDGGWGYSYYYSVILPTTGISYRFHFFNNYFILLHFNLSSKTSAIPLHIDLILSICVKLTGWERPIHQIPSFCRSLSCLSVRLIIWNQTSQFYFESSWNWQVLPLVCCRLYRTPCQLAWKRVWVALPAYCSGAAFLPAFSDTHWPSAMGILGDHSHPTSVLLHICQPLPNF